MVMVFQEHAQDLGRVRSYHNYFAASSFAKQMISRTLPELGAYRETTRRTVGLKKHMHSPGAAAHTHHQGKKHEVKSLTTAPHADRPMICPHHQSNVSAANVAASAAGNRRRRILNRILHTTDGDPQMSLQDEHLPVSVKACVHIVRGSETMYIRRKNPLSTLISHYSSPPSPPPLFLIPSFAPSPWLSTLVHARETPEHF